MDKISPLLTLVIPTYNMELYLPECLSSLIVDDEMMIQFEALVIIDGGTDHSAVIAQKFVEKYPYTFRVISKSNGNYGSCINRGIKEAKGKYIKTLDADDKFSTEAFADLLHQLQDVEADMIISDYASWDMLTGDKKVYHYGLPSSSTFSIDQLHFSPSTPLMMHAAAYRTELLREMHYCQSEGISYTDQEWIFMPVTQAKTIWYFPREIYIYRIGREGQTVDIHVWVHHAAEEVFGLKKMTQFYLDTRDHANSSIRNFMEYRLEFRTEATYRHIFVRSVGEVPESVTRDLDLYIAQNLPDIYKEMESRVTYHGRNIIGLYRRHPHLYSGFITLRRLAHKIHHA